MRYFYIDTENVQTFTFINNWNISKEDTIVLFQSPNSKNLKFEDFKRFIGTGAQFICEEVTYAEKNAMDFLILASLLIRATDCGGNHYIVSDDTGFKTAIDYLISKKPVNIYLIKPSLDDDIWALINKHSLVGQLHNDIMRIYGDSIKTLLYPTYRAVMLEQIESKEKCSKINSILENSIDLNSFRNSLRSVFGDSDGNTLYWEYKDCFLESIQKNSL